MVKMVKIGNNDIFTCIRFEQFKFTQCMVMIHSSSMICSRLLRAFLQTHLNFGEARKRQDRAVAQ